MKVPKVGGEEASGSRGSLERQMAGYSSCRVGRILRQSQGIRIDLVFKDVEHSNVRTRFHRDLSEGSEDIMTARQIYTLKI